MPINMYGKQYTQVNERIMEAHAKEAQIGCSIQSQIEWISDPDKDGLREVLMKSTVTFYRDGIAYEFDGHAHEREMKFDPDKKRQEVNFTSFIENCETSARGRALAAAGMAGDEGPSAEEMKQAMDQEERAKAQSIEDRARVEAMNVAFASYKKVQDELTDMGLPPDIFWAEFAIHTKTSNREEVSLKQWKQLNVDLISGSFGSWISDAVIRLHEESKKEGEEQPLLDDEYEGDGKPSPSMQGIKDRDNPGEEVKPAGGLAERKEERHATTLDNPNG